MFEKPEKINLGRHVDSCMTFLLQAKRDFEEAFNGEELMTVKADRYVCGLPVPAFQRQQVWTQEQQIKFIESAWKNIPLGTFMIHRMDWVAGGEPLPFSGWVVDGQQRLTAIDAYWKDGFSVFGARWSEVPRRDQRDFNFIKFSHYEINVRSEEEIKELYLLMAFGGTAHTEDDRMRVFSAKSAIV